MKCNFCLTYDSSEKVSDEAVGRGVVRKSQRGAACVRNQINVKIRSAALPSAAAGVGGVGRGTSLLAQGDRTSPAVEEDFRFPPSKNILFLSSALGVAALDSD